MAEISNALANLLTYLPSVKTILIARVWHCCDSNPPPPPHTHTHFVVILKDIQIFLCLCKNLLPLPTVVPLLKLILSVCASLYCAGISTSV